MIVDMRRDIGAAEAKMGRVADGCGRSAVTKRVVGLGKLQGSGIKAQEESGKADLGWVARMKVLGACVIVVGRLLRGKELVGLGEGHTRGSKLVSAAKVLILSRLLVKSLGDDVQSGNVGMEGAEEVLDEMKRKCGGLRRRLLRNLERVLEKIDGDRDDLAQALSAYSLATSSGAKDVMRYFLHVRSEAMTAAFDDDDETASRQESKEESILRALGLYTRTILDVQALVPRRLSESLQKLKGQPLLKDPAIKDLEGLRLDVYDRWFGDEIIYFTPYIRHDDLDGPQAAETLKGWAKMASQVLLQGFEKTLGRISEFTLIVELRTKILETWISEGGKAKGFDSSVMLDGLREVINGRLLSLLESRVSKLHLIGTEIEATLGTWASVPMDDINSLWNEELLHMDISSGASQFKKAILAQVHGRNNSVSRVTNGYETWLHLIEELSAAIEQLKTQRWDDDLESLEDDLSLENRSTLLSKDDPGMLQEHLEASLERVFKELHQKIASQLITYKESEHVGGITRFLLRVLRDIRAELPKRRDLNSFGLSLIPELHRTLASTTSSDAVDAFLVSIPQRKKVAGRALWEGTPELPVQPSPSLFRFLHTLTSSMSEIGSDLWSPAAVSVLKQHLCSQLSHQWSELLEAKEVEKPGQTNGHKEVDAEELNGAESTDDTKTNAETDIKPDHTIPVDVVIQSLFDVSILKSCLQIPGIAKADEGLEALEKVLNSQVELPASSTKRLQRSAEDYWKRTNLLFGILA
jgi:hypothetical protein